MTKFNEITAADFISRRKGIGHYEFTFLITGESVITPNATLYDAFTDIESGYEPVGWYETEEEVYLALLDLFGYVVTSTEEIVKVEK